MLSFLNAVVSMAIIWSNTTIEVPINEDINKYLKIPQAVLRVDNHNLSNPEMYYEYGVKGTTTRLISTRRVAEFKVYYKVVFSDHNISSVQEIVFKIVDNQKPIIKGDKSIYLDIGTKLPDFTKKIDYKDNYESEDNLSVKVEHNVLINILGEYNVKYIVKDKSNNESIFNQKVFVVDRIKPSILLEKDVKTGINKKFSYKDYFKITDNVDKVFKVKLDDKEVDYTKVGHYKCILTAQDQSNNESSVTFSVYIFDDQAPLIRLKHREMLVDYNQKITFEDLKNNIVDIKDNGKLISKDDVNINYYLDTTVLGTYEVFYEVLDENGLVGKDKLIIKVIDRTAPSIKLVKNLNIEVNSDEPYIPSYFEVIDNYDTVSNINVSISGKVDVNKIGDYRVIITLKDKSKNEDRIPIVFKIIDKIPPEVSYEKTIIIKDFLKPNYKDLFKIKDNYDKNPNIEINDDLINYQKIGNHNVNIKIIDQSKNITEINIDIKIVDLIPPIIEMKNKDIYLEIYSKEVDFLRYIQKYYDEYEGTLNKKTIKISGKIKYDKCGIYEIHYNGQDNSGNETNEIIFFHIEDYVKPVINVSPITIKKGENLNVFNYVKATDNYDGNIINKVKMNPSYLPTQIPGNYEVIFYCHDSQGNYTEVKVIVTVEDDFNVLNYIVYGVIIIVFSIGGYIFFKIRKRKTKIYFFLV